jgi:hypothetical protein
MQVDIIIFYSPRLGETSMAGTPKNEAELLAEMQASGWTQTVRREKTPVTEQQPHTLNATMTNQQNGFETRMVARAELERRNMLPFNKAIHKGLEVYKAPVKA